MEWELMDVFLISNLPKFIFYAINFFYVRFCSCIVNHVPMLQFVQNVNVTIISD